METARRLRYAICPPQCSVSQLWVYPLKSGAPASVGSSSLGPQGLLADRLFAAYDPATLRVLTARECPAMLQVRSTLLRAGKKLVVRFHTDPELELPLGGSPAGERVAVHRWCDEPHAAEDCGDVAAEALTQALGTPARLARAAPSGLALRHHPRYGGLALPGDAARFADWSPVSLVSEESLAWLSREVGAPVTADQLRANVVVRTGGPAFSEEWWAGAGVCADIGDRTDCRLRALRRCTRCVLATLSPATGRSTPKVLGVLRARGGSAGAVACVACAVDGDAGGDGWPLHVGARLAPVAWPAERLQRARRLLLRGVLRVLRLLQPLVAFVLRCCRGA